MPRIVHFEIHADQPERAIRFYSELLGWHFAKWESPIPYWMIVTGPNEEPGINGGLLPRPCPADGAAGVTAFVCTAGVPNLDASLARVTELGGVIALPKMPVPGVGWLAYGKDTEGNTFGLIQFDPAAGAPAAPAA